MSGYPFGTPTTFGNPTQSTTFGSFGTTQSTQVPTSFAFATQAKTTAPVFGLGATSTAAPAFGTGFGATPGFGFGTTTSAPTATNFSFGGTTSAPSTFHFGPATTTSAPNIFGGAFGTGSTFPTLGSVATTTPATTTGFSFGPGPGAFGGATTQSNTFGGGLSFGSGSTAFPTITQPGLQLVAPNVSNVTNLAAALSLPTVFGDERDAILAKWNQLQAFWGSGKGYFLSNSLPVEFMPENPFCRFKAIGYSCLPMAKPEDGLVGLILKKKESEVRSQQQHLVASLQQKLFGSSPNVSICIDGVKSIPGDKTEVVIYLQERTATGISRRIPTTDLLAFLEQPSIKSGLGGLSILALVPKAAFTKEQLKHYLDNPPTGVDPLLWQQAKLDNPDQKNLIPVAMTGFPELLFRLQCQEQENKQHQERLDLIADTIAELQKRHSVTAAKITEHKRKQLELGHRVLKVMVNQEISRKMGFAIQAEEEQLRVQLEVIQAELSAPTRFKGRLNELMSQIRMQNHQQVLARIGERYNLDSGAKEEFQQYLNYQQEGIAHLVNIIKDDLEDLNIIKAGLKEITDRRR